MEKRMTSQPHHSIPAMLPPANCFTVLVVDDMQANRVLLEKVLKQTGYGVLLATNALEALHLLREGGISVDLIVTDIEMPEMSGTALIEHIRQLPSPVARLPIIAASGNADETMRREVLHAGGDLFLTKPFDLAQLRREIATLIRAHRQPAAPRVSEDSVRATVPNRVDLPLHETK